MKKTDDTGLGVPIVSRKKNSPKGGKIAPLVAGVLSGVASGLSKSGEQSAQQDQQDAARLHNKLKKPILHSPKGKKGRGMDPTESMRFGQHSVLARDSGPSAGGDAAVGQAASIGSAIGGALAAPDRSRKHVLDE